MSETMQFEAKLSAALLQAGMPVLALGGGLILLSGSGLLLAALNGLSWAGCGFVLSLAGTPGLLWYGLRLRFDLTAFVEISRLDHTSNALVAFDLALARLGLRSGSDPRDLPQRARASRSLLIRLALVIAWQFVFFLLGSVSLYVA